ncbi:Carboxylic ester hydrolase [Aphelenchoides bicaudatus]|nr:Carboxylic ester hydrolase [Aphelenchoides bicaudatus]
MNVANCVWIFVLFQLASAIKVHLTHGIIEGNSVQVGPHTVHVFKNIPFAEPPVDELRFQKPQPKKPWFGVWDGTKYARPCMSNTSFTTSPQKNVSEDCLMMNIFADARCLRKACPMLFYLHGGSFYYDSAIMFNDTEIINKYASDKMIFVIPAYRVGLFGFLDVGHELEDAPYNVGIHDMLFALRWLQREGSKFGGNVKKISTMGNSGGATAIQLLVACPALEANIFDSVIISSGMIKFSPHANLVVTNMAAEVLNCTKDKNGITLESSQQLKCLKRASADDISAATRDTEELWAVNGPQTDTFLFPGVDYAELLKNYFKPTRMLITVTGEEMVERERGRNDTDMCLSIFSPFGYRSTETINACIQFYKGNRSQEIVRDVIFSTALKIAIENRRQQETTFFGVFNQVNHSHHANDLTYFFGLHPIVNMTANDKAMNVYYPEMIKRFIKTGVPDTNWQPINERGENYFVMNFDRDNGIVPHLVKGEIYARNRTKLWLEDFAKIEWNATHNRNSYGPSPTHQRMLALPAKEQVSSPNSSQLSDSSKKFYFTTSSQIWAVFWAILSLAIVLATVILVITASRLMFTYQSNREYTIATAGEGTKILSRQVRKYV